MDERSKNPLKDWEVDICPLRGKQCLRENCAWWVKEAKMCAVTKIALSNKA